jgi:hypothetical protein
MEKLKALLRDFQKHREQLGAIEPRKQTVERLIVEMDSEIRGKHQVKREVPDRISTSPDRERSERVEKINKKHSG